MDQKVRSKTTNSTQDHLSIRDIMDDLIITKSNAVSLVIETNAVNFDLLSDQEQMNKISSFGGLMNSLNFPMQILITTSRIDITQYLTYIANKENDAMSEGLKRQLRIYRTFVERLIVQHDVLDKNLYIVLSYYGSDNLTNPVEIAKSQQEGSLFNKKKLVEKAKISLHFRRDHILKQLKRMGLTGRQLNSQKLLEIFYDLYNPNT